MEVHSHTHTPRKKFTHYLWEFIMLFLAVFCGFIAESEREHMVEHQREKQYMRSMLEDLYSDATTIKRVYDRASVQIRFIDSLIELGNHSSIMDADVSKLYLLQGKTTRFLNIHFEDGTSSQLKNAGGMRLIRNDKVSSSIRQYWDHIETVYRVRDRLELAGENIADVSSRIFYNNFFVFPKDPLDIVNEIKPGAKFINDDPRLIAEYINRVHTKSLRTRIYLTELEQADSAANLLITLIKKEYHLE